MSAVLMMTSAFVIAFAEESDGFVQQTTYYADNSVRISLEYISARTSVK